MEANVLGGWATTDTMGRSVVLQWSSSVSMVSLMFTDRRNSRASTLGSLQQRHMYFALHGCALLMPMPPWFLVFASCVRAHACAEHGLVACAPCLRGGMMPSPAGQAVPTSPWVPGDRFMRLCACADHGLVTCARCLRGGMLTSPAGRGEAEGWRELRWGVPKWRIQWTGRWCFIVIHWHAIRVIHAT